MSTTLGGVDGVGVGVYRLGVGSSPLHGDFYAHAPMLTALLSGEVNDFGVDQLSLLGFVQEVHVVA